MQVPIPIDVRRSVLGPASIARANRRIETRACGLSGSQWPAADFDVGAGDGVAIGDGFFSLTETGHETIFLSSRHSCVRILQLAERSQSGKFRRHMDRHRRSTEWSSQEF